MKICSRFLILAVCLGLFTGCTISIGNDGIDVTTENQEESKPNKMNDDENENDENDETSRETDDEVDANIEQEKKEVSGENQTNEDPKEPETPDKKEKQQPQTDEIVLQNDAFQIFEPHPDTKATDQITVRGLARVFEGTVQYSLEDGHHVYDDGFTTAMDIDEDLWGNFEISFDLTNVPEGKHRIVLFELSAEDNSPLHVLSIPVHVVK